MLLSMTGLNFVALQYLQLAETSAVMFSMPILVTVISALFLGVVGYAWRKRAGQEWLPGRMQTWLRLHVWMSAAGLVAVLLHAGFHLDGRPGTWTMLLLLATLVSGVVGWVLYLKVPGAVASGPENLATGAARERIADLGRQLQDAAAGRSDPILAFVSHELGLPTTAAAVGAVLPEERAAFEHVKRLAQERRAEEARIGRQEALRRQLRGWLWVHVPVAIVFLLAIPWHVYDALELRWTHAVAGPADYAAPASCAKCHPRQYEEWLVSSHVTAQSSPIMDLQYRAVMAKERRENPGGKTPVATLCVTCHAPTGYISSDASTHEPLDLAVERRAASSRYGVSCVTCHQVDAVHAGDRRADPEGLAFANMANLTWTQGRTMSGPFGAPHDDALPSIGNAEHRGEALPVMSTPEFCASCHTVRVEKPPQGERRAPARVVLQNTYEEWLTQFVPKEVRRGHAQATALGCMDCHCRDLAGVAALTLDLAAKRTPLVARREAVVEALRAPIPLADPHAAFPADGFDLPLPARRRYLHTFVGVDLHTEDAVPLLPDTEGVAEGERLRRNAALHDDRTRRTHDLLRIAAGVRIDHLDRGGTLEVELANLATGHKLPAGFAFAREMWLEVAVAPAGTPDDAPASAWRCLVGGTSSGGVLPPDQALPRDDPRIHNLQAVLFDDDAKPGRAGVETVLQNEVTAVLTGEDANARGFLDREKFLEAGEARKVTIALGDVVGRWPSAQVGRLRVRMLFRNLPPEFLERLARLYEGPGATADDRRQAARARAIVGRLQILEMTRDVVDVAAVLR
jgi:hypothetical protein